MSEWLGRASADFVSDVWPSLSEVSRKRLDVFGADVARFGRSQNLVSRQDPVGEVARLMEESVRGGALLRFEPWVELLDIGSGAGFPGIVLASLNPERRVVLVERRQGRCDFLERSAARLGLGRVEVRAQDVRSIEGERFGRITGKAVTEAEEFLRWCRRCLADDGRVLVFQRDQWRPPEGWREDRSAISLAVPGGIDRWAVLVRPVSAPAG